MGGEQFVLSRPSGLFRFSKTLHKLSFLCKYITKEPGVTFCGTPEYMAPEIVKEIEYGTAVDWWATGILLFFLVSGISPYNAENEDELFEEIEVIKPDDFYFPTWVSETCKNFCLQLLEADPNQRLGGNCMKKKDFEKLMELEDAITKNKIFQATNWKNLRRENNRDSRNAGHNSSNGMNNPSNILTAKNSMDVINLNKEKLEFDSCFTEKNCDCEICDTVSLNRFKKSYHDLIKKTEHDKKEGKKTPFDNFNYINHNYWKN